MTRIALFQGHPDHSQAHLCHGLADAYMEGAAEAGHELRLFDLATMDFPLLRSQQEFEECMAPATVREAQEAILWAEHLVFIFPLWLGTMPALVKAFLEQVFRPGFSFERRAHRATRSRLAGRSARLVVTMSMPALLYRWYFRAHGIRGMERNIFRFVGIKPVRETLFGLVDTVSDTTRESWLKEMRELGRKGR